MEAKIGDKIKTTVDIEYLPKHSIGEVVGFLFDRAVIHFQNGWTKRYENRALGNGNLALTKNDFIICSN